MPVSSGDTVCRFVRTRDWSQTEGRPKPGAFKSANMSVWNQDRLNERGVELSALQIGALTGSGRAHYQVSDILRLADEAKQEGNERRGAPSNFSVQVEYRTEDEYVEPDWRKWNYAHVQVEEEATDDASKEDLRGFRRMLSLHADRPVPPNPGPVIQPS